MIYFSIVVLQNLQNGFISIEEDSKRRKQEFEDAEAPSESIASYKHSVNPNIILFNQLLKKIENNDIEAKNSSQSN